MNLTDKISRVLNCFENDSASPETDYKSVYVYPDGNNDRRQVTLGRGFTEDGGNLKKVVERYIAKGGANAEYFTSVLPYVGHGRLADDIQFKEHLKMAGDEPVMREAQDEIFVSAYLQPAFDWASNRQFVLPLSIAVIADSFLHSGTMLDFLMKRFPESKPVAGGNERVWIKQYLRTRAAWLVSKGKPLSNTLYRPAFFLGEIEKDNWAFECPLVANDSRVC